MDKPGDEGGANFSSTTSNVSDTNAGKGKTGVDLRFHLPEQYKKLNADQKDELRLWRKTQQGKQYTTNEKGKRKHINNNGPRKATIKSTVKNALEQERKKRKKDSDDMQEMPTIIASVTHKGQTTTSITAAHMEVVQKLLRIKN